MSTRTITIPLSASESAKVLPAPAAGRFKRTPKHPFYLETQPFVLQPFMCAPVLPGETVQNILLQSRVVTDPIKNPLIGWWKEYYFFYVKLRDLNIRDAMTNMMLDPTYDLGAGIRGYKAGDKWYYGSHGDDNALVRVEWLHYCMERIVQEYFRDEDISHDDARGKWGGRFLASIVDRGWLDSVRDHDTTTAEATESDQGLPPGWTMEIPENIPPGFEEHYLAWQAMRAQNITDATFEDYLKSFGIRVPKADRVDLHIPELLRYVRQWQYPSNTVNASDGSVNSAVSWSMSERADKARFCSEPGFIVGVTVTRPKVYLRRQPNLLVGHMQKSYDWLPALLGDAPATTLKKFPAEFWAGPLHHNEAYWVDLKDLFLHGEQFVNTTFFDGTGQWNDVNLPGTDNNIRDFMPTQEDIEGLFKVAAKSFVREDGIATMTVSTHLRDTT